MLSSLYLYWVKNSQYFKNQKLKLQVKIILYLLLIGYLNLKSIGELVGQWHSHKLIMQNDTNFKR